MTTFRHGPRPVVAREKKSRKERCNSWKRLRNARKFISSEQQAGPQQVRKSCRFRTKERNNFQGFDSPVRKATDFSRPFWFKPESGAGARFLAGSPPGTRPRTARFPRPCMCARSCGSARARASVPSPGLRKKVYSSNCFACWWRRRISAI